MSRAGRAASLEVVRAGPLTTVQDAGRPGLRHLGIAQCGALDTLALALGNRLVGNAPDAAALEITLGPARFRFSQRTRIALTGAVCEARLDDATVQSWWSLPVEAGQTLHLPALAHGMRSYLCVAGGIDVLSVLGSRSTDLGAHFGGLAGRALQDGDRLPLGKPGPQPAHDAPPFGLKAPQWCDFAHVDDPAHHRPAPIQRALPVRVLPGPHHAQFTLAARAALWDESWCVTPHSNRMGYRLAGALLERAAGQELLSHAVLPGTIQVPPNGQPIVLMNDAQTTGGYAQIGHVLRADLWKLAQVRLNQHVRFVPATLEQARAALDTEAAYLRQVDAALAIHPAMRPKPNRSPL